MSQLSRSSIGVYDGPSVLSPRDRALVELVARFRQLSAGHVQAALFADCTSKTPCDRALKRLCERGYLARLARPVGGDGGGSSQYVYQLGRAGWRLLGLQGTFWTARSVNLHSLAIADCFVRLRTAEQQGHLTVLRFDTEPTCHRRVGSIRLTPDAYAEVGFAERRVKFSFYLEIDRGTEKADVIRDKFVRYWHAYQQWDEEHFPYVVFVVPDAARLRDVARVVNTGPEAAHALFYIFEAASFVKDIHSNMQ